MVDWGQVGKASWELLGPDVQAWKRLAPGGEKASLADFGSAALDASILIPGVGLAGRTAGKAALKVGSSAVRKELGERAAKEAGEAVAKRAKPKQYGKLRAKVRDGAVRKYDKLEASTLKNKKFSSLKESPVTGLAATNTSKRVLGGKLLARAAVNEARYSPVRNALAGVGAGGNGGGELPNPNNGNNVIFLGGGGGGGYGAAGVGGMATGASGFGKLNNTARGDYVNL